MHFDCLTLGLEVLLELELELKLPLQLELKLKLKLGKAFAQSLRAASWANSLPAAAQPKQFNKKFC